MTDNDKDDNQPDDFSVVVNLATMVIVILLAIVALIGV